jgi:hypothetical protein
MTAAADSVAPRSELGGDYEVVADWVDRFLPTKGELRADTASIASLKSRVLTELDFITGTAEEQADLRDTFVTTERIRGAMSPDLPLVLGRKGTGKTALFRMLSEQAMTRAIVVQSPFQLRNTNAILGPEGFGGIAAILENKNLEWRQFWAFYSSIAAARSIDDVRPSEPLASALPKTLASELDVVNAFETVTSIPKFGLLLYDWLGRLDSASGDKRLLLYDGLDTCFGSSEQERRRRSEAVAGLFVFWMDREAGLKNLRTKILLRDDIWRALSFENKSHLFGRSESLRWSDQAEFVKVALKQAARSGALRDLFQKQSDGRRTDLDKIDSWAEVDVFAFWNLLVGERMKGGRTTFTRNWVWNRLADGKGDHSPRYLLQLLGTVTSFERNLSRTSPYERSIIRPRAFNECLPTVSEQALGALREEFPELLPVLQRLEAVGRTPIPAGELDSVTDLLSLSQEVGVLDIYEGTEDAVERYRVPEIYRHALHMTRRGQM